MEDRLTSSKGMFHKDMLSLNPSSTFMTFKERIGSKFQPIPIEPGEKNIFPVETMKEFNLTQHDT